MDTASPSYFADGPTVRKVGPTGVADIYAVAFSTERAHELAAQLNLVDALITLLARYDEVFPTPEAKALLMRVRNEGGVL